MNVKLARSYRSKNGNVTFVYAVSGNAADLAAYAAIQGEYARTDDKGTPLWFTTRCIGPTGKLIITTNNKVVPDMSLFDQAASLATQYGGNFGEQLAKSAAAMLLGGNSNSNPVAPGVPTAIDVAESTDLADL